VDGSVRLGHFSEASLGRGDILGLAQRVDGFVDDDIEREWSRNVTPARMHVEFGDGSTQSLRIDLPLGHPSRPMSAADQEAKAVDCFRAAARPMRDGAARELREYVGGLETHDDMRALARILDPVA
jgi:2-methylcitrate dehydratase PrpD